jgi:hypothetical protein
MPAAMGVFAVLVIGGVVSRLVPHPENFTAIGAIALFSGVYFRRAGVAVLAPVLALLISDFVLSLQWSMVSFPYMQYVLYGGMALLGVAIRSRPTGLNVLGMTLLASVLYFLASNFEVWITGSGLKYDRTAAGLVECYVAALPFFRNSLAGNLVFTALLFTLWRMLEPAQATAPARVAMHA